ncbi:MAG: MFS transporter [Acidobacteriota bacterium]
MLRKWKIAIVLFFIGAHNFADRSSVSAIFPILRHDLALSDVVLAGVGTIFLWTYAAGSPFAGILADRLPRARLLQCGLIAWSLIMMFTGLVHSGRELLAMRSLLGLAECLYVPAAFALLADHYGPEMRATAIGIQICGVNLGLIAGNTLAPFLSERLGWRTGFALLGGAGLVLALISVFVLEEGPLRHAKPETRTSTFESVRLTFAAPGYTLVVLAAMLIAVCTWSFLNWLPLFYHEHFHLNLTASGFTSSSALQTAAIIGALAGGILSDRVGRRSGTGRLWLLAGSRFIAAPILLAFLCNLPVLGLSAMIFSYNLIIGLGAASETYTICEVAGKGRESTALGVFTLANCVGGGAGVLATVYLQHRFGWAPAFACLALFALVASMALLGARKQVRKAQLRSAAEAFAAIAPQVSS